jgi:nitrate/nitrite-specific signal transduction histidine kinase
MELPGTFRKRNKANVPQFSREPEMGALGTSFFIMAEEFFSSYVY